MPKKIEISHRTIIFTLLLLGSIWVIGKMLDLVLIIFVSLILAAALNPLIDKLEKAKFSRTLAIVVVYFGLIAIISGIIAGIVPGLIKQTGILIDMLPGAVNQVAFFNEHQQEISKQALSMIGSLPENFLKLIFSLFGNIIDVLTALAITFYMLLYRPHLGKYLESLFGPEQRDHLLDVVSQIEKRLGSWVRGEAILMFAVGLLTYIGLTFLGLEIALPLAILAGLLEIVPNIGPLISAVPAVLVGLTIDPLIAIATASLYFIVQFLENHLLVPNIMSKAAGVNPLVSIIALMAGFRLAGPAGAILAIPILIIVQVIVHKLFHIKRLNITPGDE